MEEVGNTSWPIDGRVLITIGFGLLMFWLTRFVTYYALVPLAKQLENRSNWRGIIEKHTQTRISAYHLAIERLLKRAEGFWGNKPFGALALARSMQIAFLYPLVAILIGWAWGNAGSLGGLRFLPDEPDDMTRLWQSALLLCVMIVSMLSMFIAVKFSDFADQKLTILQNTLDQRGGFLSKAPRWSFSIASYLIFLGAVAVAFAVAEDTTTIWFLFFTVLPLLNACADWISLGATRHFLGKIGRDTNDIPAILRDVFLDILVALACLLALVLAVILVLEGWGAFRPDTLLFDWRTYWNSVRIGVPGAATPLILMATTTLLPTVVHLCVGLSAFFAAESRSWHKAVALMEDQEHNEDFTDYNAIIILLRRGQTFAMVRAFALVGGFLGLPIWLAWQFVTR